MIRSTFISFGLHSFLLTLAYFGLPAFKTNEPIELPIDIVEDTPISSKTSLKLGDTKEKKIKKINKKIEKEEKIKKNSPPPPPIPTKKEVEKKKLALKKDKEIKKIATLIKKKPKTEIKKQIKSNPPKIVKKPEKITKVILCSGKIYFDLIEAREQLKKDDVVFFRIEQLYPFPAKALANELKPYRKKAKFYWCQEEPKNMGAWFSVRDYIQWTLDNIKANNNQISYIGRKPDASPATGFAKRHISQQQEIINEVFDK